MHGGRNQVTMLAFTPAEHTNEHTYVMQAAQPLRRKWVIKLVSVTQHLASMCILDNTNQVTQHTPMASISHDGWYKVIEMATAGGLARHPVGGRMVRCQ